MITFVLSRIIDPRYGRIQYYRWFVKAFLPKIVGASLDRASVEVPNEPFAAGGLANEDAFIFLQIAGKRTKRHDEASIVRRGYVWVPWLFAVRKTLYSHQLWIVPVRKISSLHTVDAMAPI